MSNISVVIGAGIVGLHVAQVLRERGDEVYVLERDDTLGEQTSGRNSGVIHAGIFYKAGSLKEKTCLAGNRLTYEWLERLKVPHRPSGKWVVPEPGQEAELEPFFEHLRKLPIPTPRLFAPEQLGDEEPLLRPTKAILVPSTGLVDAAAYVKALAVYLAEQGVEVLTHCEVQGIGDSILQTSRGEIPFDLAVNCAGLFADQIARSAGLDGYEVRPCRGDYYILAQSAIRRPIYHLPYQGAPGLGVHLTPTLDNQILVGPNAFFIEKKLDYSHHSKRDDFLKSVEYYLPTLPSPKLQPAYSGNRPKLYYQGKAVADFTIELRDNWVHLLGIESPGLTAAPALAQEVVSMLR